MKDQLVEMLKLQQKLNDETNGLGWEKGVTKHGKKIDWRRCAFLEAAELIDSYPWKHWKNIEAQPDWENIKIETVDIWHFILSMLLEENAKGRKESFDSLSERLMTLPNFEAFGNGFKKPKNHYEKIETVEAFISSLFDSKSDTFEHTDRFFLIACDADLDLETLYRLYVGKNVLNTFRQEHGYKEGNYVKHWGDQEDNEVMQSLLEQNAYTPTQLYEALEERYEKALTQA